MFYKPLCLQLINNPLIAIHQGIALSLLSGKKKQHKHKLFGPDSLRTFLTLTPGCPRVKKFLPTTGAAGKRTFWCGRPRFSARTSMTRRVVEKLCTKKVCVDFLAPMLCCCKTYGCEHGGDKGCTLYEGSCLS